MDEYFKEYCTGCGLCENCGLTKLTYKSDGFPYPESVNSEMENFCSKVCPMSKEILSRYMPSTLWGEYSGFYSAYATNPEVRHTASSGGVLTAICIDLLEKNKVDGIIQTCADKTIPTETVTIISRTVEEVKKLFRITIRSLQSIKKN